MNDVELWIDVVQLVLVFLMAQLKRVNGMNIFKNCSNAL